MKHCPNSDCHGLKKFGFVSEFNDSAVVCGDCDTALVAGPAPTAQVQDKAAPDPQMKFVSILVGSKEADLVIIESLLTEVDIPYMARGEQIQDLFGFGRLVRVNPITGPVEFLVAEADAADATELLADFLVVAATESDE